MANPKGNVEAIRPYNYKPAGNKALKAHIGLKLDREDKEKLKQIPDWPDKLREAIAKLIEEADNQETNAA
jgi:hypothetical protein